MIDKDALLKHVKALGLDQNSFAVFGSGPLVVRNLRLGRDIDLITTIDMMDSLLSLNKPDSRSSDRRVVFKKGLIEVFDSWGPGEWDIDELIRTADLFDGVRFVNLESVRRWKKYWQEKKI